MRLSDVLRLRGSIAFRKGHLRRSESTRPHLHHLLRPEGNTKVRSIKEVGLRPLQLITEELADRGCVRLQRQNDAVY